jgi:predicted alpha/beta hydrolase family esterase
MATAITNFVIVHGTMGSPEENWFPWLRKKLETYGHKVIVPLFPTPDGQNFYAWLSVAQKALETLDTINTVLIGHSTGASFVLRLAELSPTPYKAIFSICPFIRDLGIQDFDSLNTSFVHHAFKWQNIQHNAGNIFCFAGDNDPYVPLSYSQEIAIHCNTDLITVPNGGHLNAAAGFLEFPLLLEKIRQTGLI